MSDVKRMSKITIVTVAGESTPPGWRARIFTTTGGQNRPAPPPETGKVLIKLGERAGIPTRVKMTQTELELHDTNERW